MAISRANAQKLALWLAYHEPTLFRHLAAYAQAAPRPRMGALGDSSGVDLAPISVDTSGIGADALSSPIDTSGGGFWSSLASGVSSLGSDLGSAVGDVTGYLTSSQGLSNLTSLANTYFASKATVANANLQGQILQAQTARVAAGQAPAPVTYTTNAQGQLVPVMYSGNQASPLSTQGIAALYPSGLASLTPYLPYLLIGGGILAVLLMRRS